MKPGALAAAAGLALRVSGSPLAAEEPQVKPAIRGLVSMGAYRFVGAGGDPVNTLEPLRAKPGIFGGLVVIASWAQLQPTPDAELHDGTRSTRRWPTCAPTRSVRIYALMKQLGPEIVFQTYRTNPSDFEGTIRMGVAQGATSIELWQDYRGFPEVANAKLEHWAELIEANKTP